MAKQKIIEVSLTPAEAQHLQTAVRGANVQHQDDIGRSNPALNRVLSKIEKAQALADAEDLEPVKDPSADATE